MLDDNINFVKDEHGKIYIEDRDGEMFSPITKK